MQTRPRRIVPLRPPGQDCAQAGSETHARLQATFASFYNALFDAACAANDEQRHERTLQLLRAVKAREPEIIDDICADLARSGTPADALEARHLERALAPHCAALALEPGEQALLEAALAEQMLAPEKRGLAARVSPVAPDDRDSAARLAARLRAVGMELEHAGAADGADSGAPDSAEAPQAPAAATPPARAGSARRAVARTLLALAVITLSALLLEPVRTAIRPPAPLPERTVPSPVPELTPAVAEQAQQDAAPEPGAIEVALATADPAPVTEPAPAAAQPAQAVPAPGVPGEAVPVPEAPAAAAGTVTAPARDAPPATAARLAAQVDYLLRRGDAALAALRLSEPFADSAAANYAAVLAIDAHNAAAQQGLERVVESYAGLARGALSRGDVAYAQQLLARARTVLPESPALAQLEQAITDATTTGR